MRGGGAVLVEMRTERCLNFYFVTPLPQIPRLMSKDLGLAMDTSKLSQTPVPLGRLAHALYEEISKDDQFKDKGELRI